MDREEYDRHWRLEYERRRRVPHYCDGTLGMIKRKHKITRMFHAGDSPSGRHDLPRFRCRVCNFTGFSTVAPPPPKPSYRRK